MLLPATLLALTIAPVLPAAGAELPPPMTDEQVAALVGQAPPVPVELDLGLETRLIDFIDCTNADDPHPMMDQGTSTVVTGPAGRYRVTAAHRHAFFSYRYRSAGVDRPVLIVIEYPDDARRIMSFMTHDSARPGEPHVSFSKEGGVYTGPPLPVSNKMQYFTYLAWPQDEWPPLIVVNFDNGKSPAAAGRMWIHAVDELTPLQVEAPEPDRERFIDIFFPLAFLMYRDNFGWRSRNSPEHLVDYCKMIGVNRVTMMVYANQGWGAMCTIPSWDAKEQPGPWTLDSILETMDRKGGVGLVAGIVATGRTQNGIRGMYGTIKSGGRDIIDMSPEETKATVIRGLDEFLDRYGKYESLKGIALGSMETIGFWELLNDRGVLGDVVAHIKQQRPDLMVQTYFGNGYLQTPYFDGNRDPKTEADIIADWEQRGGSWPDFLGDQVLAVWKQAPYRHDPDDARSVPGLTAFEMSHPDDHRLHIQYRFQPRSPIYYDVARSQRLSDLAGLDHAAIFASFTEGWIGLLADLNFWYSKKWTAPDMNPPDDLSLASLAEAIGHRDRLGISLGAWTVKSYGYERHLRRFAQAFRSLPPVPLEQVAAPDTIRVHWGVYGGKRYVSVVSLIPFPSEAAVDGQQVHLLPYDLVTIVDAAQTAPTVTGAAPDAYRQFVLDRTARYRGLYDEVSALEAAAAPGVYLQPADQAEALVKQDRFHAADLALGWGLESELALRRDILAPTEIPAPRIAAPSFTGSLDDWPQAAADIRAESGEYIPGHLYFPNSWTGPEDLSMRIRLGHDGEQVYVGVAVRDSVADEGDGLSLRLSPSNYLDFRSASAKWEIDWRVNRPATPSLSAKAGDFSYVARQTPGGYVVEGSAPLAALDLAPGGAIGFQAALSDKDQAANLPGHSWAVKQAMLYPHEPKFAFWSDARNLGRLDLER